LLVGIPLVALVLGTMYWLTGGRYIGTDNSYVGAEKVLVTPQVSGAVVTIHVVEGQHVKIGDALFDIDPAPYNVAAALANGKLAAAKIEFENLKTTYASNIDQLAMGKQAIDVRQADYDRKTDLLNTKSGTRNDVDVALAALIQARQIQTFVESTQATTRVKLGGGPDSSIDNFPDYMQAKAAADDANRNLANTHVVAAINGIATQVDQIQLGRVAAAGTPVFAVVSDSNQWIDANPKESDLTYVREGQKAGVSVDAYPDRTYAGTVCSIAPGTGSQFSILPAQNASGNWVKVVQRVPLRVCFDKGVDMSDLRSGMSAYVSIDTGRVRTMGTLFEDLGSLVGLGSAKAAAAK
jgi:membrane fusion protein, multidrug efflux system